MKKNLISKYASTAAAVLLLAACGGDYPEPGPIVGPVSGGEDPTPSDIEYFITPDGDFADWEKIPAQELVQSTVPADAYYPTGRKVMAYAGATYINLYVEYNDTPEEPVQIMHLYIDSDNDQTTGMGNPAWTNDGADLLFEGELFDEAGEFLGYDPAIFGWVGEPLSGGWDWEEVVAAGLGFCNISEPVELDNGNKAFEMTVLRSAVPGLGKVFRMGVALQYDWNDIAYLPSGSAVNNNGTLVHGPVENLLLGAKQSPATAQPLDARITVDGDMSDWETLKQSERYEATVPESVYYKGAYRMLATYNKDYLYLYVEYDGSEETGAGILDVYMDTDAAFDSNGLATTGAGSWLWANDGTDLFTQAAIADYDSAVYQYTGEPLANEWEWTEVLAAGSGAMKGSTPVELDNGRMAVEIEILRSAIPGLGNEMLVGILLEKADWSGECGAVPQGPADANGGFTAAEKIRIDFTGRTTPGGTVTPEPIGPVSKTISIDGDLSDWDDVNASTGYVSECPDGAFYTTARTLKLTADENFVFLYVEYDNTGTIPDIFTVYMDSDCAFDASGNATTGTGSWLFANNGTDVMIQGSITDETGAAGWAWAEVFMYSGTPLANEWAWTSILSGGSGAVNNCAPVDLGNGRSAFEACFMRTVIPELGSAIEIGIDLEASWNPVGVLPAGDSAGSGAHVAAEKVHMVLP